MATIDINVLYMILGVEAIFALFGVCYWFYTQYIRKILRARILEEFGGIPKVIKELIAKPYITKFTWEKGTYIVDPKLFSLDSKNNPIGYWWKGDSRQIEIGLHNKLAPVTNDEGEILDKFIDPKILQNELDAKDLQDLAHGDRDKVYFMVIGGLVIALFITGIAGFYFYNQQSTQILQMSKHYGDLIANLTRTGGNVIIP